MSHVIDCLQERGSSSWLISLPIEQHGFVLHKGDFIDALCLWYGWMPPRLPSHCVCGTDFSISHAFSCPHGAFPAIRHNNIRDLTASLMSEVCHDVKVEPVLQPLTGEALRYKLLFVKMIPVLISVLLVFGVVNINMHFLTFVCLAPWPLLTGLQHLALPTASMSRRTLRKKQGINWYLPCLIESE